MNILKITEKNRNQDSKTKLDTVGHSVVGSILCQLRFIVNSTKTKIVMREKTYLKAGGITEVMKH